MAHIKAGAYHLGYLVALNMNLNTERHGSVYFSCLQTPSSLINRYSVQKVHSQYTQKFIHLKKQMFNFHGLVSGLDSKVENGLCLPLNN